jgi:hypothetical protein
MGMHESCQAFMPMLLSSCFWLDISLHHPKMAMELGETDRKVRRLTYKGSHFCKIILNISTKSFTVIYKYFLKTTYLVLIKRGGGTGPMNSQQPGGCQGAKSRQAKRLEDKKRRYIKSLLLIEGFFLLLSL